ncbi:MAG TPA: hypothetical protein VEU55_05195 [Gemmatimonadales bacterium]|nr:hypothetical protein [Gemmatimonadales bacterium]
MNGCLRDTLRLGCLVLVLAAALAAWWFRAPLERTARRWLGAHSTRLPAVGDTVGAPTPKALASSQTKIDRLKRPSAPDSVVLSPNEVASMIGSGIDWSVRKSFDSLRVELLEGTIAVHCRLDTRVIPPDALGPLAGMLNPMEPLRIAGPLAIARPGIARFTVVELSLRGLPFPPPLVKQLAQRVAGADSSGAVPLRVPPAFSDVIDVAVHPTGVVLYRVKRRKP